MVNRLSILSLPSNDSIGLSSSATCQLQWTLADWDIDYSIVESSAPVELGLHVPHSDIRRLVFPLGWSERDYHRETSTGPGRSLSTGSLFLSPRLSTEVGHQRSEWHADTDHQPADSNSRWKRQLLLLCQWHSLFEHQWECAVEHSPSLAHCPRSRSNSV